MQRTNRVLWGCSNNGNNPLNLRSGYALSDFDRKHVVNFTYRYELPKFSLPRRSRAKSPMGGRSPARPSFRAGQPYSVVDYSGAVGSIFYGVNDGITNPIVPLSGCTPQKALTGHSGATPGISALDPNCFGLPLLNPGDLNGAIPANDPYETNLSTTVNAISSGSRGRGGETSSS